MNSASARSDIYLPSSQRSEYLIARPIRGDTSRFDNDDAADERQQRSPMRNQHQRATVELLRKARFEQLLGAVVHRIARFIEQQDGRLEQIRSRDCNGLALTARDSLAAFSDGHREPTGMQIDELGDSG